MWAEQPHCYHRPVMFSRRLQKVAIVGRPNVGKSSLFNRLIGQRLSLVHDQPGVTRDRLYSETDWDGTPFEVVDTGGLDSGDHAVIREHIQEQVDRALDEAAAIVFLVDGKSGISALDETTASRLRRTGRKVILAVNKVDSQKKASWTAEFASLGLGEGIWISALHGLNIDALLDEIIADLRAAEEPLDPEGEKPVRVAIVGRPNVGKSSLINRLVNDVRVLVDDRPGTTRDPVPVEYDGEAGRLILVDTAGMRKGAKIDNYVEKVSVTMARKVLDRADLGLLVLDGTAGVQSQDQRVAGLIQQMGRPVIIAVNKWDLCGHDPTAVRECEEHIRDRLQFLPYAPHCYISALKGDGMDKLIQAILKVGSSKGTYLTTGRLNSLLRQAALVHPPPSRKGKQLQIRYAAQLKNKTATFVFKVNDKDLIHFSYQRHLENILRDAADFTGVPIRFIFREAGRR